MLVTDAVALPTLSLSFPLLLTCSFLRLLLVQGAERGPVPAHAVLSALRAAVSRLRACSTFCQLPFPPSASSI